MSYEIIATIKYYLRGSNRQRSFTWTHCRIPKNEEMQRKIAEYERVYVEDIHVSDWTAEKVDKAS